MATKDWEKVKDNKEGIEFIKSGNSVFIYQESPEYAKIYGNYRVWIGKTVENDNGVYSSHNSKSEALAYAKSYMRTH